MNIKGCLAMILAGGRGIRLGALTRYYAKPAVHFGGNHRIIDFTLSNCNCSKIEAVGILSQHFTNDLRAYIDEIHEPMPKHSDIYMLPPQNSNDTYKGTADAVFKNIEFIEQFNPENVLILSSDHIYSMDYNEMLAFHMKSGADVTVASTIVPINEAPRFGIIKTEKDGRVHEFEEKPPRPKSCLASMGIYIFKWSVLKRYLLADSVSILTRHDFGGDVLPKMLRAGESVYTYQFDGYWRDVGTVASLWEANMDLLGGSASCRLPNYERKVHGSYINNTPNFISKSSVVHQSVMSGDCTIFGNVEHSVLGDSVTVDQDAEVVNSVIMPGAYIGNNVKIRNAVIGTGAVIMDNAEIGTEDGADFFVDREMCAKGVSLISPWVCISNNMKLQGGSHVYSEMHIKSISKPNVQSEQDCSNIADDSILYPFRHKSIYRQSVI